MIIIKMEERKMSHTTWSVTRSREICVCEDHKRAGNTTDLQNINRK